MIAYSVWKDPDDKHEPLDQLIAVVHGYEDKYDATPTEVLCNPKVYAALPEIEDVHVEPRPYVPTGEFYLRHE